MVNTFPIEFFVPDVSRFRVYNMAQPERNIRRFLLKSWKYWHINYFNKFITKVRHDAYCLCNIFKLCSRIYALYILSLLLNRWSNRIYSYYRPRTPFLFPAFTTLLQCVSVDTSYTTTALFTWLMQCLCTSQVSQNTPFSLTITLPILSEQWYHLVYLMFL